MFDTTHFEHHKLTPLSPGFGKYAEVLDPAKLSFASTIVIGSNSARSNDDGASGRTDENSASASTVKLMLMRPKRIEELQHWIERLNAYGRDDYMPDYVEKRAKLLTDFMKKLIKLKRYEKDAKTVSLLSVVLDVLAAEKALARDIVGERRHVLAFGELIVPALDYLLDTMRNKIDSARSTRDGKVDKQAQVALTQQFGIGLFVLLDMWEAFSTKLADLNSFAKLSKVQGGRLAKDVAQFVKK